MCSSTSSSKAIASSTYSRCSPTPPSSSDSTSCVIVTTSVTPVMMAVTSAWNSVSTGSEDATASRSPSGASSLAATEPSSTTVSLSSG